MYKIHVSCLRKFDKGGAVVVTLYYISRLKKCFMKTNVMNKKLVLVGSLAVTTIVATVISNFSTPDAAYTPRTQNHSENTPGIDGAFDLYHKLRGDYSREDWLRALNEAEMMKVNRTDFTWSDHGPDNVGGRTRAILVDKNDINHVYAGSVSGGLFESFNRANEWNIIEFIKCYCSFKRTITTNSNNTFYSFFTKIVISLFHAFSSHKSLAPCSFKDGSAPDMDAGDAFAA